jgi:hypothetical protein
VGVSDGSADSLESLEALSSEVPRLANAGRFDEALALCEAFISRAESKPLPERSVVIAEAMSLESWCLRRARRGERLLETVHMLQERYAHADELAARNAATWALFYEALWLLTVVQPEAAIEVSEELRIRLAANDPLLRRAANLFLGVCVSLAWGPPRRSIRDIVALALLRFANPAGERPHRWAGLEPVRRGRLIEAAVRRRRLEQAVRL